MFPSSLVRSSISLSEGDRLHARMKCPHCYFGFLQACVFRSRCNGSVDVHRRFRQCTYSNIIDDDRSIAKYETKLIFVPVKRVRRLEISLVMTLLFREHVDKRIRRVLIARTHQGTIGAVVPKVEILLHDDRLAEKETLVFERVYGKLYRSCPCLFSSSVPYFDRCWKRSEVCGQFSALIVLPDGSCIS